MKTLDMAFVQTDMVTIGQFIFTVCIALSSLLSRLIPVLVDLRDNVGVDYWFEATSTEVALTPKIHIGDFFNGDDRRVPLFFPLTFLLKVDGPDLLPGERAGSR
mmetsp:Transcript_599/g.802  ORF Transcript_599/g.802 Transcript_599/m.802 type:complete len:104 (+) Transcript_599:36-347(+)